MKMKSLVRFQPCFSLFAVCPSGPTEQCRRNWQSSHPMAQGRAQQGFVTEVAQSCFVWPIIHWGSLRDSEYLCQKAWKKNHHKNPNVPHKGDKELYQEDKQPCEIAVQEKRAETTQTHPGIDILKGTDIWTISSQSHQWWPPLTHP